MLPREGGRWARWIPGEGWKAGLCGGEKSTVVVQFVNILGWHIDERWAVARKVTEIGRIGELDDVGAGEPDVGSRSVGVRTNKNVISSRGRHSIGKGGDGESVRGSAFPPDSAISTLSIVTSHSLKWVTSKSREAMIVCFVPEKIRE